MYDGSKIPILFLLGIVVIGLTSVPDSFGELIDFQPELFACDNPNDGDEEFHKIDLLDGSHISTSQSIIDGFPSVYIGCTGMAQDPTSGIYYVIGKDFMTDDRYLASIDPVYGYGTLIGSPVEKFSSLAFLSDGSLRGMTGSGATNPDTIYDINTSTGVTTELCGILMGNLGFNYLVYNSDTDELKNFHFVDEFEVYQMTITDENLSICEENGGSGRTQIPSINIGNPLNGSESHGFSYNPFEDVYYFINDSVNALYTISSDFATTTLIGEMDALSQMKGLAFDLFPTPFFPNAEINVDGTGEVKDFGSFGDREEPRDLVVIGDSGFLTWSEWLDPISEDGLMFSKSVDGSSWSTPVLLDQVFTGVSDDIFHRLFLTDGVDNLNVFYTKKVGVETRLYSVSSYDQGDTWDSPVEIFDDVLSDEYFATVKGDNIYVVSTSGDVNDWTVKSSTDGGVSYGSEVLIPQIVDGDQPDPTSGTSWGIEQSDDGVNVVISFRDISQAVAQFKMWESHSVNSGASFSTPTEISTGTSNGGGFQTTVYFDGTDVMILYGSEGDRLTQVRSSNSGVTWGSPEDITDDEDCSTNGGSETQVVQNKFDESTVHFMCPRAMPSGIQMQTLHTNDFGDNWTSPTDILDVGRTLNTDEFGVAVYGDNVFYTFQNSVDDIQFLVNSTDGGNTFNGEQILHEPNSPPRLAWVHIASSEVALYIASEPNDNLYAWYLSITPPVILPVITLTGDSLIELALNETYLEQGAICLDDVEGNLIVTIGGDTVDTSTAGVYTITYDCENSLFVDAIQVTRTVEVASIPQVELWHVDLICDGETALDLSEMLEFLQICPILGADPPTITLLGDAITLVDIGDTYSDDGATAFDNGDGDVTSNIVVAGVGSIDTSVSGVFFVTYNVEDSLGNIAVEKIRTIVVAQQSSGGSGGGSGIGEGSDVSGFTSTTPEFDIEDLDSNQVQDLLDMLAPALQSTIIQEIIQTFFEFQVLDNEHNNVPINSFLSNERLGIRWSTGDDIVITSITPASSPFTFTFELIPVIKEGSGFAISENALTYNLQIPDKKCDLEFSFDCVDTIRYSVPVTVHALINGTDAFNVGNILVDLTEDELNPILIILFFTILIPIVAGIIWKLKGGHNPSNVKDLLH